MATWDEIRKEIDRRSEQTGIGQQDAVRREKIAAVAAITGRPLTIYATDFLNEGKLRTVGSQGMSLDLEDKTAFLQATHNIPDGPLDILLHSPGGSPTATESIVNLLRRRFAPIRFIVPDVAKSAATMLALSGDEILVSPDAEFGPIDPQLRIAGEGRVVIAPAQAIIDQFEFAAAELEKNPGRALAWMPILREFGPSLLQESRNSIELARSLVAEWLKAYMFNGDENLAQAAQDIAKYMGDHNNFNSHARRVSPAFLKRTFPDLKITEMTDDMADAPQLLSAVMDVYWAIIVTFGNTPAFKIVESDAESAYIRISRQ